MGGLFLILGDFQVRRILTPFLFSQPFFWVFRGGEGGKRPFATNRLPQDRALGVVMTNGDDFIEIITVFNYTRGDIYTTLPHQDNIHAHISLLPYLICRQNGNIARKSKS